MSVSVTAETLYDTLDERTLALLAQRRTKDGVRRRGWVVRRSLMGADLVGLILAFVAAEVIYPVQMNRAGALSQFAEFAFLMLCLPCWVVAAKLYGLYDKDEERTDHSTADDFAGVFHLVTVSTWIVYAVSLNTDWFNPQFSKLFLFWAFAVVGVPLARSGARAYCRRQVHYLQNTIILGAGDVGQLIARKLLKHAEYGINLVGFVDSQPRERAAGLDHLTLLGDPDALPELVKLLDVERVIVAFSNEGHEDVLDLIRTMNELGIQVDVVPRFFEVLSPGIDLHSVEGVVMCSLRPPKLSNSSRLIKRSLDLVGGAVGLLLLSPLFAGIALAIKFDSPGPVLFRQVRKGEEGRLFRILKFRTMALGADERKADVAHLNKHLAPGGDPRMFKIDDDPRVTRVGRFLRRWSLDELPQLANVLVGEMSLVGPRPLILDEAKHVDEWGAHRVRLKPGLTGLWQVLGRDGIPFEEMVKFDYLYVTSWSLGGDLRLLLRTIPILVRGA